MSTWTFYDSLYVFGGDTDDLGVGFDLDANGHNVDADLDDVVDWWCC